MCVGLEETFVVIHKDPASAYVFVCLYGWNDLTRYSKKGVVNKVKPVLEHPDVSSALASVMAGMTSTAPANFVHLYCLVQ